MKKSIALAGFVALLGSTSAMAADLVTYQEPSTLEVKASEINWTGGYIGGVLGGNWADSDQKIRNPSGEKFGKTITLKPSMFNGGLYGGFNFAVPSSRFVVGLETDFLWNTGDGTNSRNINVDKNGRSFDPNEIWKEGGTGEKLWRLASDVTDAAGKIIGVKGSVITDTVRLKWHEDGITGVGSVPVGNARGHQDGDFTGKLGVSTKQVWNGSTRLRAGYAIGEEGRFLPFATAGVAYSEIENRLSVDGPKTAPLAKGKGDGYHYSKTKSDTKIGWTAGVGVDYVPPVLNDHLVLRAEYRYSDYGNITNKYKIGDQVWKKKSDFTTNDFRVGVAYKF